MKAQLTIDLRSVSYAKLFYRNQFGETVRTKPKVPTIHGGQRFELSALSPYPGLYPETMYARAKRLDLLDRWTQVCIYQFRNNHSMVFTGHNATKKWRQYNEHIYNRKPTNSKPKTKKALH